MIGGVTIWEIIWTGGLPHLSRSPQLPRLPYLHVNKPLIAERLTRSILSYLYLSICLYGIQFIDSPIYSVQL